MRIRVWNENTVRAGQVAWDEDVADQSMDSHMIATECVEDAEKYAQECDGNATTYHTRLAATIRENLDYEQPGA